MPRRTAKTSSARVSEHVPSSGAEQIDEWNREDASELEAHLGLSDAHNIAISARDWTVETIVQQIRHGNIDLDPAFQRRNAWKDNRRTRLIESFILSFPVPQIVLAENPRRKKSYIVIDGKQRLMTIAGLYLDDYRDYWRQHAFAGLEILDELAGVPLEAFLVEGRFAHYKRQLDNADIRATVISGFKDEGILYDIFYRINTGSVPLSSQELRQVLNRGEFAQFLLAATATHNPFWDVIGIAEPDARLRDVELLLRQIAWARYSRDYAGNMKKFLDDTMSRLNEAWQTEGTRTERIAGEVLEAARATTSLYEEDAGRKYKNGRFERSLNRALLEVQTAFLITPSVRDAAIRRRARVVEGFKALSADREFLSAIEATTKSLANTRTRFEKYGSMLAHAIGQEVAPIQIGRR